MTGTLQWDGHDAGTLVRRWRASGVHPFLEVGSTNDIALALARDGAPHGTVVVAEGQTSGRGRSGRRWASPVGAGIWLSVMLRPGGGPVSAAPVQVGRIVANAIVRQHPRAQARLKWPNDVLLDGRKVAGILCESSGGSGGVEVLVVGIGINTDHRRGEALAPELRDVATTISLVTGEPTPREPLAGEIVRQILALDNSRLAALSADDVGEVCELDALQGRWVGVELEGAPAQMQAMRIDDDGALVVRDATGALRRVVSGSVRFSAVGSLPAVGWGGR